MSAVLRRRSESSEREVRAMLDQTRQPRIPCLFERGSAVHTYWVNRCAGFTVIDERGRDIGRVRRADPERSEVVVTRRVRKQRIAMAAVHAVSPRDGIIHVRNLSRCAGAGVVPAGAVGEETLPWFDLVDGDVGSDERQDPLHRRIRQRALSFFHALDARTRAAADAGSVAARRLAAALRERATQLAYGLRSRCARGLFRLARRIEPHSPEIR